MLITFALATSYAPAFRRAGQPIGIQLSELAKTASMDPYWSTKGALLGIAADRAESDLLELQEREMLYLDYLKREKARVQELEAELAQLRGSPAAAAAVAAPAPAPAAAPAPTVAAAPGPEVTELQAEVASLREALEASETKREVEVQKVASFWLEKLAKAGEETAKVKAEAADSAPPPAPAPMPIASANAAAQERIAALEEEIDRLEEESDSLTDRLEVQGETIMLANGRLDQVSAAFEAQTLKAEEELQRVSAFWLEKRAALKASADETSALREALDGAEVKREVDVQRVSAYWLDRVAALKAQLAAAAALTPEGSSAAAAPPSADAAAAWLDADLAEKHAAELAAAALKAEIELQATSAFWIDRTRALKERVGASEAKAAAAAPAEKKPAGKGGKAKK